MMSSNPRKQRKQMYNAPLHLKRRLLLPVQALVFLGYPLHAPGKKDKLRDSHLYEINVPQLFFAGTRDSLCDLGLLKKVLARIKAAPELEIIDGGDHSFKILKSLNISPDQVHDRILTRMALWLKANIN